MVILIAAALAVLLGAAGWALGAYAFDSTTAGVVLAAVFALVGVAISGVVGGFAGGWAAGRARDRDLGGVPTEQQHTRKRRHGEG